MCAITDAIVHEFIVSLPSAPPRVEIEESETSPHSRARQDDEPIDIPTVLEVSGSGARCCNCGCQHICALDGIIRCIACASEDIEYISDDGEPGGSGGGGGGPATIAETGHEAIAAATTAATFTCEQCLAAKPETDFATVLQAPLGSPCICDGCLETLPMDLVRALCRLKQTCPSCGDPSAGLCPACRETGEDAPPVIDHLLWAGRGIWRHYRQERTRFLLAVQRAASTDLLAMAEAMAHYLTESNETQIEVSPDRVLRCWQRELGMPA